MLDLTQSVNFMQYAQLPLLLFFGIGALLTILMQSSSATTVLVLTAASSGLVSYRM